MAMVITMLPPVLTVNPNMLIMDILLSHPHRQARHTPQRRPHLQCPVHPWHILPTTTITVLSMLLIRTRQWECLHLRMVAINHRKLQLSMTLVPPQTAQLFVRIAQTHRHQLVMSIPTPSLLSNLNDAVAYTYTKRAIEEVLSVFQTSHWHHTP
jgi:hypothetical protein